MKLNWFRRWRESGRRHRAAHRLLDVMFASKPDVLAQGRLAPRHRHRMTILEIRTAPSGEIESLLLGIVRHPRPHPLGRGEDVLELLEYRPAESRLEVAGARNLTRAKKT